MTTKTSKAIETATQLVKDLVKVALRNTPAGLVMELTTMAAVEAQVNDMVSIVGFRDGFVSVFECKGGSY